MSEERFCTCMECKKQFRREELTDIHDNYGIFFKAVCDDCYPKVEKYIRGNNYGDYLTHDELYGENY